ncbi:hypothetical protein F5883DRAFT_129383 [Diaporthe sp. PMI_573]|nr:hypothetical protein F5883DRAFT_129383 [Diaporthaceae sp. PMI_573]
MRTTPGNSQYQGGQQPQQPQQPLPQQQPVPQQQPALQQELGFQQQTLFQQQSLQPQAPQPNPQMTEQPLPDSIGGALSSTSFLTASSSLDIQPPIQSPYPHDTDTSLSLVQPLYGFDGSPSPGGLTPSLLTASSSLDIQPLIQSPYPHDTDTSLSLVPLPSSHTTQQPLYGFDGDPVQSFPTASSSLDIEALLQSPYPHDTDTSLSLVPLPSSHTTQQPLYGSGGDQVQSFPTASLSSSQVPVQRQEQEALRPLASFGPLPSSATTQQPPPGLGPSPFRGGMTQQQSHGSESSGGKKRKTNQTP